LVSAGRPSVLDIANRVLLVHRGPTPQGYGELLNPGTSGSISPLLLPAAAIELAELWR